MNPTLDQDADLQRIFRWVEEQEAAYVKAGMDRREASLWARRRKYGIAREQWDPSWRRIGLMRSRFISMLFKKHRRGNSWGGENRITKTCDAICGCGWQQLRDHVEKQFRPGMTWENHGNGGELWVVDHIKPVCLFDWWTDAGLLAAFHWTNVQPLWWAEHREKSRGDQVSARKRKQVDPEYRMRLPTYGALPPLEGTDEEIMARLAEELGIAQ